MRSVHGQGGGDSGSSARSGGVRIRSIKPEWLEDERLALASPVARVMSVALITLADDEGRGRGNLTTLGGRVFPGSANPREDSAKALEELARLRYVVLYESDGQSYFQIRNWAKHQRVDRPTPSRIPAPPDGNEETVAIPTTLTPLANLRESSRTLGEASGTFAPDLGPRIMDLGSGSRDMSESAPPPLGPDKPDPSDSVRLVFDAWLSEHVDPAHHAKCKLNGKRKALIKARLRERYTPDQLIAAIRGVKNSRWHMGENDEGRRYTGLETILRDGAQVEKFESLPPSSPSAARKRGVAPAVSHEAFEASYDPQRDDPELAWRETANA
jgi:hypothetical protein